MERRNQNCFGKAKISAKDQVNSAEDSDDSFKELEDDITELRKIDPKFAPTAPVISSTCYLEPSLSRTFWPVPSRFEITSVDCIHMCIYKTLRINISLICDTISEEMLL